MGRTSSGAWFAAGAAFAVVMAGGTAYAATGGTFVLGRANTASTLTTLSNSAGPALQLNAKSGSAPFGVNSGVKVPNLNGDRLDGLDSLSFLRSTGKAADANKLDGLDSLSFLRSTGKAADAHKLDGLDSTAFAKANAQAVEVSDIGYPFDLDEDGVDDTLFAFVTCPAGSALTGGGYFNLTDEAVLASFGDDFDGSWNVLTTWDGVTAPADLVAQARCLDLTGSAPTAALRSSGEDGTTTSSADRLRAAKAARR